MSQIDAPRDNEAIAFAGPQRPRIKGGAWWNDTHVRSLLYQAGVLFAVLAIGWWFAGNAIENLTRAGIATGFAFLTREAGFGISENLVEYSPASTYGWALVVGLINTFKVSVVGCVLTTLLGTFLGILRLSSNPLLSRLMSIYVEFIRNTPLLLQLFFWYALITALPQLT